jgi:hypothetical protein
MLCLLRLLLQYTKRKTSSRLCRYPPPCMRTSASQAEPAASAAITHLKGVHLHLARSSRRDISQGMLHFSPSCRNSQVATEYKYIACPPT